VPLLPTTQRKPARRKETDEIRFGFRIDGARLLSRFFPIRRSRMCPAHCTAGPHKITTVVGYLYRVLE